MMKGETMILRQRKGRNKEKNGNHDREGIPKMVTVFPEKALVSD